MPTEQPNRTIDDIIVQLKKDNPSPRAYVERHGDMFFSNKSKMLKRYEELLREEATNLWEDRVRQRKKEEDAEADHRSRVQTAVLAIQQFQSNIDYVDLTPENRRLFRQLSDEIKRKSLDVWDKDEKVIFKFWRQLTRFGLKHENACIELQSYKPNSSVPFRQFDGLSLALAFGSLSNFCFYQSYFYS